MNAPEMAIPKKKGALAPFSWKVENPIKFTHHEFP